MKIDGRSKRKLTSKIIDERLLGRPIIRLDDFIDVRTKIRFQCLNEECDNVWPAIPNNVINGKKTGCRPCANKNRRMTDGQIDDSLVGRPIKRFDRCIKSDVPIRFQCLKADCNKIWPARPNEIVNRGSGCPKCAGKMHLTNEELDLRLKELGTNILRDDNFTDVRVGMWFKCGNAGCTERWHTAPQHILGEYSGCKICSGWKINDEIIDRRLVGRNIERLSKGNGTSAPMDFKCTICNYIWSTDPNSVLNKETGCRPCSSGKSEKIIHNIMAKSNIVFERHKYIKKIIDIIEPTKNIIVDFYIPELRLVIEYNGAQHYEIVRFGSCAQEEAKTNLEKQKLRDAYLQQFCDNNNIKLMWIDGRKYHHSKLENYINIEFVPQIQKMIAARAA